MTLAAPLLIGRDRELADLRARVLGPAPTAVLVEGAPGIGKTALLDAVAAAAGRRVLRAAARADGDGVAHGLLSELLAPVVDLAARLPAAQRSALSAARDGAAEVDRLTLLAAVGSLLREAGAERPLLLAVDDLQWADGPSREALLATARRLRDPRVAFVLAARAGACAPAPEGVERLALAPLADDDARRLLLAVDDRLGAGVARDLLAAAGGSPLALAALPALLTPAQRAGRAPIGPAPAPGAELRRAFERRLAALPAEARRAAVVAAAMGTGDAAWLLAALVELGDEPPALAAAQRAGLVRVGECGVAFAHPVVRLAVYDAAGVEERRAAHRALAAAAEDPPSRARHLAAAVHRADAATARALAGEARAARAAGGHAEAALAFRRAAELAPDPRLAAAFAGEAAEDLAAAGRSDDAPAPAAGARHGGPAARPPVGRVADRPGLHAAEPDATHALLVDEAERRLAAGDVAIGVDLLLEASMTPATAGDVLRRTRVAQRLRQAGDHAEPERAAVARAAAARELIVVGREAEGRALLEAVASELDRVEALELAEPLVVAALAWLWLGRPAPARRLVDRVAAALERAEVLGRLALPLAVRAQAEVAAGRWDVARRHATEAAQLARDAGQGSVAGLALAARARVAAGTGDLDRARQDGRDALALAEAAGALGHVADAAAALGLAELAAGCPEAAVPWLERATAGASRLGRGHPVAVSAAGDLVEALVGAGRHDDAEARAAGLVARAAATGGAVAAALAARAELLVAGDRPSESLEAAALAAQERVELPFERARTELAVGDRRRRTGRRAEARGPLQRAVAVFEGLGAEPWARRAREVLAAAAAGR